MASGLQLGHRRLDRPVPVHHRQPAPPRLLHRRQQLLPPRSLMSTSIYIPSDPAQPEQLSARLGWLSIPDGGNRGAQISLSQSPRAQGARGPAGGADGLGLGRPNPSGRPDSCPLVRPPTHSITYSRRLEEVRCRFLKRRCERTLRWARARRHLPRVQPERLQQRLVVPDPT
jgi:hypothetical protein